MPSSARAGAKLRDKIGGSMYKASGTQRTGRQFYYSVSTAGHEGKSLRSVLALSLPLLFESRDSKLLTHGPQRATTEFYVHVVPLFYNKKGK